MVKQKSMVMGNSMIVIKNISMRKLFILALVLTMVSSPLWARGAYKWTDDHGVTHYSDRMRGGDEASIINVKVNEPRETAADDESSSDEKSGSDKGKAIADRKAQAQANKEQKKIRKANCAKAREQLAANQNMSRMYRLDKKGERIYLNDVERADIIRRSEDAVKDWCN